jgi:hypothetical protein
MRGAFLVCDLGILMLKYSGGYDLYSIDEGQKPGGLKNGDRV